MYNDKELTCKDCGAQFAFTASEQEFYNEKGFTNEPGRCPGCRSARKAEGRNNNRGGGFGRSSEREMFTATCATCGKPAQVPFRPTGDKPVYCRDCYQPRSRF